MSVTENSVLLPTRERLVEFENRCNKNIPFSVQNMHIDEEVYPNPLGFLRRITGRVLYQCAVCGRLREGFGRSSDI